ncbi:MAG TPA: hypothetical protein VGL91_00585 [Acidobacteriota bacterium]
MEKLKGLLRVTKSCFCFCLILACIAPLYATNVQKEFEVFFPWVVSGQFGLISLETAIVVYNPGSETAMVTLESVKADFDGPQSFSLAPAKTNVVFFRGVQVGAVHVKSNVPVTASSYTIDRSALNPLKIISDLTLSGQPLTSKAVLPVFIGTTLADNTALALVYRQGGCYRFTLYDSEGAQVASRTEAFGFNLSRPPSENAAFFVTELFPDVAPGFIGSLVVEHVSPVNIAQSFSVSALYTSDLRLAPASVTPIDTPSQYIVTVKSGGSSTDLAAQYGFTISMSNSSASPVVGVMTEEVARAVARDPRVDSVTIKNVDISDSSTCK